MLNGPLLCQRSSEGFESLGAFNQPVFRSHGQIRAALLSELGAQYADYFARPDFDQASATIGWISQPAGTARRWVDLVPEEQARLDPIRQTMAKRFAQYRATLAASPENSSRNNFGKLLAQAASVPGMEYLYFVGDQPVVAFWGFKDAGAREGVDPLQLTPGAMRLTPRPEVPPPEPERGIPVPPLVPVGRWRWWHWLLGLLLLLLLLLGMLAWWWGWPFDPRFVFNPPAHLPAVLSGPGVATPLLPGRERILVPGATVPGGTVSGGGVPAGSTLPNGTLPNETLPGGGLDGKTPLAGDAAATGPGDGHDTKPPAAPLPHTGDLPALPPPGTANGRGQPLAIPGGAQPGPADFMQGVWRSRSGLMLNGKSAEEYYRFDHAGQGDVTIRSRDGSVQCSGPVQAVVGADRQLSFREATQLGCSDGSAVSGAVTECKPNGDAASCAGVNESNGSRFGVQIERAGGP